MAQLDTKYKPENIQDMECVIQYPIKRNPAQSLQKNAITVFGPRLKNLLLKYLRDIESVFLELIPYELKCPIMLPQEETTTSLTGYSSYTSRNLQRCYSP